MTDQLKVEAGAGYAVFTEEGGGGEFTWRVGGDYEVGKKVRIFGGFNSITGDGGSIDVFSLGIRKDF